MADQKKKSLQKIQTVISSQVRTHILGEQAGLSGGYPMSRWSTVEGAEIAPIGKMWKIEIRKISSPRYSLQSPLQAAVLAPRNFSRLFDLTTEG
jgi:hypothetical protein